MSSIVKTIEKKSSGSKMKSSNKLKINKIFSIMNVKK